jgi:membrane-associated protein
MDVLNTLIVSLAGWSWALPIVLLMVVVDGFFPPVPSESVLVAMAAIGAATGLPNPWLLLLIAALGSFLGDNIAFLIGRRFGASRFRILRAKRVAAIMERASINLERSPGAVILTARFVPVGRVVVNVLAGASGFSRRRFVSLSAISGLAWAAYSVLIGVTAGAWMHDNPVLGAALAIVAALTVGLVIDRVGRLRSSVRSSSPRESPEEVAASDNPQHRPHDMRDQVSHNVAGAFIENSQKNNV